MADENTLENNIDYELLTVVRRHLAYTWWDEDLDNRLLDYIRDGKAYLARLAHGQTLTWAEGTSERRMLKEYVFYANAKQLSQFTELYFSDLTSFQLDKAVEEAIAVGDGDGE
jgi:hypothetical protein